MQVKVRNFFLTRIEKLKRVCINTHQTIVANYESIHFDNDVKYLLLWLVKFKIKSKNLIVTFCFI